MEDFEPEALENWKVWRELSVKKYAEEYDRLNVYFEVYTGESAVSQGSMDKALERLNEMGLIEESDGAKLINLEKWNLGKAVVRKRGTLIFLLPLLG
jgi:arginyl-tRNA synthetase